MKAGDFVVVVHEVDQDWSFGRCAGKVCCHVYLIAPVCDAVVFVAGLGVIVTPLPHMQEGLFPVSYTEKM